MFVGASEPLLKNASLLPITSYNTKITNVRLEVEDRKVNQCQRIVVVFKIIDSFT